jgi:HEXXH motif-containing protein
LSTHSNVQLDLNPREPWVLPIAGETHVDFPPHFGWLFDRLRTPSPDVREELTARNFVFRDNPRRSILREVMHEAERLLAASPRLETALQAAVGQIILLRARPSFDISHSEPRWPQAIFITVPSRQTQVSALRSVENVVHEAMHLQLTVLERAIPLIADETSKMASPWRLEPRDFQGILHGVYVFRCVAEFFATSRLHEVLHYEGMRYVARRRAQIADELSGVDFDRLAFGLTRTGQDLLTALINDPRTPEPRHTPTLPT